VVGTRWYVNHGLTLRCQVRGEISSQFYAQVYMERWTVKNGPLIVL